MYSEYAKVKKKNTFNAKFWYLGIESKTNDVFLLDILTQRDQKADKYTFLEFFSQKFLDIK